MKCQSLFSGKNKKSLINLLSAEFTQRILKFKNNKKKALHRSRKMVLQASTIEEKHYYKQVHFQKKGITNKHSSRRRHFLWGGGGAKNCMY